MLRDRLASSQYEGFVELPARDVGRRKAIYVEAHIETEIQLSLASKRVPIYQTNGV